MNATPLIVAGGGVCIQYNQDATTSESVWMPKQITSKFDWWFQWPGGQGAHLKARVVVDFMGMDMVLSTINHTMAFL